MLHDIRGLLSRFSIGVMLAVIMQYCITLKHDLFSVRQEHLCACLLYDDYLLYVVNKPRGRALMHKCNKPAWGDERRPCWHVLGSWSFNTFAINKAKNKVKMCVRRGGRNKFVFNQEESATLSWTLFPHASIFCSNTHRRSSLFLEGKKSYYFWNHLGGTKW